MPGAAGNHGIALAIPALHWRKPFSRRRSLFAGFYRAPRFPPSASGIFPGRTHQQLCPGSRHHRLRRSFVASCRGRWHSFSSSRSLPVSGFHGSRRHFHARPCRGLSGVRFSPPRHSRKVSGITECLSISVRLTDKIRNRRPGPPIRLLLPRKFLPRHAGSRVPLSNEFSLGPQSVVPAFSFFVVWPAAGRPGGNQSPGIRRGYAGHAGRLRQGFRHRPQSGAGTGRRSARRAPRGTLRDSLSRQPLAVALRAAHLPSVCGGAVGIHS